MKQSIRTIITFLLLQSYGSSCLGQIAIDNIHEIEKIQNGTTFIAMNNPDSEENKKYVEVFKENWNISKIKIVDYDQIEELLSPNSYFLTVGGYVTEAQFVRLYQNGSSQNGIDFSNTHLYLELWTVDNQYFEPTKKDKEKNIDSHKVQIAQFELYTDFATLQDPDLLYQTDFDAGGHIFNWGPGILKNQLQTLQHYLNEAKEKSLYSSTLIPEEITKLKTETLYVPDYALLKFNPLTGDQFREHDRDKLFKKYGFDYELLSTSELNRKIASEEKPFYYLIYVKSSTDKYVTIYNSETGQIIYSKYSPLSYNLKSKDFSKLDDAISKQ